MMKANNLEAAMHAKPFRPFVIELDSGKQINVVHEDYVIFLPPDKGTVLIVETRDDGDHHVIVDLEYISSVSFIKKKRA